MWRGWNVASAADMDCRLDSFRVLFAYHSGRIENPAITYNDTREIFANGKVLNFTGDPMTLFELGNQKLCYEFLKHKIAEREPLTTELVLETHAILTGGTYDERRYIERGERPGVFKKHDYVTGKAEVGSMPEDVPDDINGLLSELAELMDRPALSGNEVLKAAAYFHSRFEYIHPFADGNGRVGRTLMNYFLMTHGHPPVIIYDENKADYYAALECYDADEDIRSMTEFLTRQVELTWSKALERETKRARSNQPAEGSRPVTE
jgi:Fic family protein